MFLFKAFIWIPVGECNRPNKIRFEDNVTVSLAPLNHIQLFMCDRDSKMTNQSLRMNGINFENHLLPENKY